MNSSDWMGEVLRRVEKEWEAQPPHTRRYIPPPKSLRLPESAPDDIEQAVARASDLGLNPNAVRIIWQRNILMQILMDLIAELRDQVQWYPQDVFPGFTADDPASQSRTPDRIAGVAMRDAWTRAAQMADSAEARLREVTGDE